MTAKKVFEINGNFKSSPLLDAAQKVNRICSKLSIPYAVIGGLAVVRNGAVRTTIDVDILMTKAGWQTIAEASPEGLETGPDHAFDTANEIDIHILFPGEDWEMVIPIPDPETVREWDNDLGAWFIDLVHLIELKTAVFLKKRDEDGIEIAAKDLGDIVELVKNNLDSIDDTFIGKLSRPVRNEFKRIFDSVTK
jgi:hypothetical protein